jgi:hypothetical protein
MPRIRIAVNHKHIAGALKGDATHCMIAQAIKEKFPAARWIMVDLQTVRWTNRNEGLRYKYLTPLAAQKALLKFDYGETVTPFRFQLSAPVVIEPVAVSGERTKKAKAVRKPNTAKYKHNKAAPEASSVRRHGLRNIMGLERGSQYAG